MYSCNANIRIEMLGSTNVWMYDYQKCLIVKICAQKSKKQNVQKCLKHF